MKKIEEGVFLVKKNYGTFGRDEDSAPVVKVESFQLLTGKKGGLNGKILINRCFQITQYDVKVVEEDEAIRIMNIWKESGEISAIANENTNTKCVREDNGKPKVTYHGRKGWQRPLFTFKMKHPEGGFEAYICPECDKVHIGKTMTKNLTQAELEFIYYKMGTAGSFREGLYDLFFKADTGNQMKMQMMWPELYVLKKYSNEMGYWEDLQQRFISYQQDNK